MEDFEIITRDEFDSEEQAEILKNLRAFNRAQAGESHQKALVIAYKDKAGELVGGISGKTFWNWLYVELLWIREDQRKHRLGSKLLAAAEAEALRRGCDHAHLITYSFQALGFYKKQGYSVFGELPDCPRGQTQYFLKKALKRGSTSF